MPMYTLKQVQEIVNRVTTESQARSDVINAVGSTTVGAIGGAAVATGLATVAAGETVMAGSALSGATALLGGKTAVAALVVPFGTVFFRNAVIIGAAVGLAGWAAYRYGYPRAKAWYQARQEAQAQAAKDLATRKEDEARGVQHADEIIPPAQRPAVATA